MRFATSWALAVVAVFSGSAAASATPHNSTPASISLPRNILDSGAHWESMEENGRKGLVGESSRKTKLVSGAIATPFSIGDLGRATIHSSLRFFVPVDCSDYNSVALAFYGETGAPVYAISIFKNPGTPVGQGVLRVNGDVALTLQPGQWHTIDLNQRKGHCEVRVWVNGSPKPEKAQWNGLLAGANITKVGVRVYGDPVEVSNFEMEATPALPKKLDRSLLPKPIFDANPDFVKLYDLAWEQAFAHVKEQDGIPQSPYMDEACFDDSIWIWDTCFMSLFTKYSPKQFPGVESLSNFYEPMYDGAPIKLNIWFADNPPLFAWAERDNYRFNGDKKRLRWLLEEKQFLQMHYRWFQSAAPGKKLPYSRNGIDIKPQPLGFNWSGQHNGMDNTPRFEVPGTLAIDAVAQQGLAALQISQLCGEVGDIRGRDEWKAEYERLKGLVNSHYWDEVEGFYYDLLPDEKTFTHMRTPASFWPVLAGMASPQQVARMAKYIGDPNELGGFVPWVTLSHSDKNFNAATGDYWRGAMWLPTAYMGIRALGENGQRSLANSTAEAILGQMSRTYKNYEPHTIWECYSPNKDEPATEHGQRVRPDFCGWSALGPISLFIENVLGFYDVSAVNHSISWNLHQAGRHGIKNLRFGDTVTDILTDGAGRIEVNSNRAYVLKVNGREFKVKKGKQSFRLG